MSEQETLTKKITSYIFLLWARILIWVLISYLSICIFTFQKCKILMVEKFILKERKFKIFIFQIKI